MKQLAVALAGTSFSRGAIYRSQLWFDGLSDNKDDPADATWRARVALGLSHQFDRQGGPGELASPIVDFVCDVMKPVRPLTAINDFLVTAEFFAREGRSFGLKARERREQSEKRSLTGVAK